MRWWNLTLLLLMQQAKGMMRRRRVFMVGHMHFAYVPYMSQGHTSSRCMLKDAIAHVLDIPVNGLAGRHLRFINSSRMDTPT
jgi:hypothetical protein